MYLSFSIFWELSNAGVKQILVTPARAKDSKLTVISSLPPGEIWVRLSEDLKNHAMYLDSPPVVLAALSARYPQHKASLSLPLGDFPSSAPKHKNC